MRTTAIILLCTALGLAACGGADPTSSVYAAMPVADCEAQACRGLRIVDSNAETFRADNARRAALAQAVAQLD